MVRRHLTGVNIAGNTLAVNYKGADKVVTVIPAMLPPSVSVRSFRSDYREDKDVECASLRMARTSGPSGRDQASGCCASFAIRSIVNL